MIKREKARLERALCALVDHEGEVIDALCESSHQEHALHDICDALRLIVDGPSVSEESKP